MTASSGIGCDKSCGVAMDVIADWRIVVDNVKAAGNFRPRS